MAEEEQGNPSSGEHDPYQPFPEPDGAPEGGKRSTDFERRSWLDHRTLPMVAVAVAVLVVVAAIFIGGGDEDAASPGPAASQPVVDGTTTSVAGSALSSVPANPCAGFSYGANLLGEPSVAKEPGVHIWQDIYGFHIRFVPVVGSNNQVSGTVAWEGAPLILDPEDPAGALATVDRIQFELGGDGNEVNFRADCTTTSMTVDLMAGGARLDPNMITVGQGQDPITDNPVVLVRGG